MKRIKLPGVYISQNGQHYLYKPYIKKKDREKYPHIETDARGFYTKTINLGKVTDPEHAIRKAHNEETEVLYRAINQYSLDWLWDEYQQSRTFRTLAPATQKRYTSASERLLNYQGRVNNKPKRLGEFDARHLTTPAIRKILDKKKNTFEKEQPDKPNAGSSELNNQLAVLAAMYKHGIQYHNAIAQVGNPTKGITKFKTGKRRHQFTAQDYAVVYRIAQETAPEYLPIAMELAKYLASRGIEITDELTVGDRTRQDDGSYIITLNRRKGSKTTSIICGDELNAAWKAAIDLHKITPIGTTPLLINRSGHRVTRNAITKAWQKLKRELQARELDQHYFWFHDLKKWGVTHSKDKGIAGQSRQMQELYDLEAKKYEQPK